MSQLTLSLGLLATLGCSANNQSKSHQSVSPVRTPQSQAAEAQPGDPETLGALLLANSLAAEDDLVLADMNTEDVDGAVDSLKAKVVQQYTEANGQVATATIATETQKQWTLFQGKYGTAGLSCHAGVIKGATKGRIDNAHKKPPQTDQAHRNVCDLLKSKLNPGQVDKLAEGGMYDRLMARCAGLPVPPDFDLAKAHKAMCELFKGFIAGAHASHIPPPVPGVSSSGSTPSQTPAQLPAKGAAHLTSTDAPAPGPVPVSSLMPALLEKLAPGADIQMMAFLLGRLAARNCGLEITLPPMFDNNTPTNKLPPVVEPPMFDNNTPANKLPPVVEEDGKLPPDVKVSGFDLNGVAKECSKSASLLRCPAIYGPVQAYGARCVSLGHHAYTCACDSIICDTKLPETTPPAVK